MDSVKTSSKEKQIMNNQNWDKIRNRVEYQVLDKAWDQIKEQVKGHIHGHVINELRWWVKDYEHDRILIQTKE